MALTSIKQATIGTIITFRSKNATDLTVWQGTLESIGSYRSVLVYGDPTPYNAAVRQADPSVPVDPELLTFFTITVDNDAQQPTVMRFADQWIEPGSLIEVALGNQVTILVTDPLNNTQAILSLLANAGYATRVTG